MEGGRANRGAAGWFEVELVMENKGWGMLGDDDSFESQPGAVAVAGLDHVQTLSDEILISVDDVEVVPEELECLQATNRCRSIVSDLQALRDASRSPSRERQANADRVGVTTIRV